MQKLNRKRVQKVAGVDLGDKYSHIMVLDAPSGEVEEEARIRTTPKGFQDAFSKRGRMRIALEAGAHSAWTSRLLEEWGHEVLIANPRKLRLIYENRRKNDRVDAMYLARLARLDPSLLSPLRHRGEAAQADLACLRARDALVGARTKLVNHLRGVVKASGGRLPSWSPERFGPASVSSIPPVLQPALQPLLETLQTITAQIRAYDKTLERMAKKVYPETARLRQVTGVGPLTSLAYILTLEDPARFSKSRTVGAFLGLVPATRSSGESDPQCRISKEGNQYLRRLMVGSAQYILGPFGPECDLRRHGEAIALRGGKNAKKRGIVAVARKLSVLLHRLWVSGEPYDPHHAISLRKERNQRPVIGAGGHRPDQDIPVLAAVKGKPASRAAGRP